MSKVRNTCQDFHAANEVPEDVSNKTKTAQPGGKLSVRIWRLVDVDVSASSPAMLKGMAGFYVQAVIVTASAAIALLLVWAWMSG